MVRTILDHVIESADKRIARLEAANRELLGVYAEFCQYRADWVDLGVAVDGIREVMKPTAPPTQLTINE